MGKIICPCGNQVGTCRCPKEMSGACNSNCSKNKPTDIKKKNELAMLEPNYKVTLIGKAGALLGFGEVINVTYNRKSVIVMIEIPLET